VSDLRRLLEQAIEHTQSLTFDMSPPVLHELGIIAAVEEAVDKVGNEHGIDVKFSDDGLPKQMDPGVRDLLFQAVRELMVNVVKHAQASSMGVSVFRENGCILISVEDNGIGFDTSHIGVRTWNGGGFGLASMRERFGYIEGRVEIECIPGHGARVTLVAPLLSDPLTGGRAP
jgi:signal transduction histidine kinase